MDYSHANVKLIGKKILLVPGFKSILYIFNNMMYHFHHSTQVLYQYFLFSFELCWIWFYFALPAIIANIYYFFYVLFHFVFLLNTKLYVCMCVCIFSFTNWLRPLQTDDPVDMHCIRPFVSIYVYYMYEFKQYIYRITLRNSGKDEWNANISPNDDDDDDDYDVDDGESMYCNIVIFVFTFLSLVTSITTGMYAYHFKYI